MASKLTWVLTPSTKKMFFEVLQFEVALLRGCIHYKKLFYNFSYECVSHQVVFFSILTVKNLNFLVFISLLHCWIRFSRTKVTNKLFFTSDRLFTAVCSSNINSWDIFPRISYIFYQHYQPKFKPLEQKLNTHF